MKEPIILFAVPNNCDVPYRGQINTGAGMSELTTTASNTTDFPSSTKEAPDVDNAHSNPKVIIGVVIGVSIIVVVASIMATSVTVFIFKLRNRQEAGAIVRVTSWSQGNAAATEEQYVDPKLIISRKHQK